MAAPSGSTLPAKLSAELPKGCRFGLHHLSTPPLKVDALCSAPPGERPDRTFCEKHFLAVSVDASADEHKPFLVLGLEVFVYTTAHATALFVSKADSTGLLGHASLPLGAPSPVRHICAAFIRHLVETRRRKGVQLVVSLFARAQGQYLFPGSVNQPGKHVLDDRGLVKWWCRVLDPLLASPPVADGAPPWTSVKGYLVVPGLDAHEIRAFIPCSSSSSHWLLGHPLERISHYHREFDWVPPRCLIPRFPDDPKSRFRDELDEEAAQSGSMQNLGTWKSVKTLDTFWEVMGFRQECSSGRMTGFIWVVFDDESGEDTEPRTPPDAALRPPETPSKRPRVDVSPNTTPRKLFPSKTEPAAVKVHGSSEENMRMRKRKKKKKRLRGIVVPRLPRIKTEQRNYLIDRPASSKYYSWTPEGRGVKIVDESGYKRTVELLLHLDFATLDKATGSSRRWIAEAGMGSLWSVEVTGARELPSPSRKGQADQAPPHINNLSGLVKRKRSDTTGSESQTGKDGQSEPQMLNPQGREEHPVVNMLGSGLVRKKPKI